MICEKCWWLKKYGIDFLKNYGFVTKESMAKFLGIDPHNFKYDHNYKHYRDLLKENDM